MTHEQARQQIDALREQIEYHNKKYYTEDAPEISDEQYDALFRELTDLEERWPGLRSPHSPTLWVGGGLLDGLAKILRDEAEESIRREAEARLERKKTLIQAGVQLMREGQAAKGRAFLKRVADEFSDEEGIRIQLGQIFAAAGQYAEAAEMYEEAMLSQPREAAAYTGAVTAWLKLREFEKAENVYKAILRTFGGHPSTFGKMAKMYLEWRQRGQAEDMALRALQADPQQTDALEVMAVLDKK